MESIVSLKEGSVHVPNCKSYLWQGLKEGVLGDARDFNNIETRAIIKYFYLQSKAQKEINAILTEILREICTILFHRQKLGDPV